MIFFFSCLSEEHLSNLKDLVWQTLWYVYFIIRILILFFFSVTQLRGKIYTCDFTSRSRFLSNVTLRKWRHIYLSRFIKLLFGFRKTRESGRDMTLTLTMLVTPCSRCLLLWPLKDGQGEYSYCVQRNATPLPPPPPIGNSECIIRLRVIYQDIMHAASVTSTSSIHGAF